ncbi:hypothetical protein D3C87_687580 [compost metagenome]
MKVTLVLQEEPDNIRIEMDADDLETATIINMKGRFYVYQAFKWQQGEIWYQRVKPPLMLCAPTGKDVKP